MLDLSIIILSYNTKVLTLDCLESLLADKTNRKYDVWVVDNTSRDGSAEAVKRQYPEVNIIESKRNLGFSGGNNLGLKKAYHLSKYSLLLNSDTLIKPGFINTILKIAEEYNYSILSCKLIGHDHKLQPNAGELPKPLALFVWLSGLDDIFRAVFRIPSYQERNAGFYKGTKRVGWVSGSVMLFRNSDIQKVGFLDDRIFMYAEDVDYCWRTGMKGLNVGWTDECEVIHLGGGSLQKPKYSQWIGEFMGLIYLYQKHYGKMQANLLRLSIRFFILLRILAFGLLGRKEVALTYAKVIREI